MLPNSVSSVVRLLAYIGTLTAALMLVAAPCFGDVVDFQQLATQDDWDAGVSRVAGPGGEAWYLQPGERQFIPVKGVRFPKEYSYGVWFQFDPGATDGVHSLLSSDRYRRYNLSIFDGESIDLNYSQKGGGRGLFRAEYDFEPGRWYQLVVTQAKEGGVAFYVNGELVMFAAPPVPAMASFPVESIGAYSVDTGKYDHFFQGKIGSPKLYDYVLSADEVRALYQDGTRVPAILPIPQQAIFAENEAPLALSGLRNVVLEDKLLDRTTPAVVELVGTLNAATGYQLKVSESASNVAMSIRIRKGAVPPGLSADAAAEAYVMRVDSDGIEITALTSRGAMYGIYTLLSYVELHPKALPQVTINDWPEFPFRGFLYLDHGEPPSIGTKEIQRDMRKLIPRLSKHRINQLQIRCVDWILLEDPEVAQAVRELIQYAETYHVDIAPLSRSYGHAKGFLWKDLRTGHTDTIYDEQVALAGDEAVALSVRNVIVTNNTPIVIKAADGTVYEEGEDYEVINGELKTEWDHPPNTPSPWSRPRLLETNEPWRIRRLDDGRITDGEIVAVTYDVPRVLRGQGHGAYNPFSEYTREIQSTSLRLMEELLRDDTLESKYLNLGLDEIWTLKGEGRSDAERDLSEEEMFVYEANLLSEEIQANNPSRRLMIWSDMLDPRQTPSWKQTLDVEAMVTADLSRDIILMPWYYGSDSRSITSIYGSLRYFTEEGFSLAGTSGHDPLNNLLWGEALLYTKYDLMGDPEGMLYTTWAHGGGDKMIGLSAFTQATWSPGQVRVEAALELAELLRQAGLGGAITRKKWDPESVDFAALKAFPDKGLIPWMLRASLAEVQQDMLFMGADRLTVLKRAGFDIPFYSGLGLAWLEHAQAR